MTSSRRSNRVHFGRAVAAFGGYDRLVVDDPGRKRIRIADPVAKSTERVLRFGPFRLVAAQRLLLEGENPIRIGSRALEILIALVEHPGEVVGKDELMARAWPGTFVEDGNLKFQISALRRSLGDGQGGNRYLTTIPGRGYSFVAPLRLADEFMPAPPQVPPNPARKARTMSDSSSSDQPKAALPYTPWWLDFDKLADDVVLQAAVLNGQVVGRDKVRKLLGFARSLYEFQDFRYKGWYPDGWIEEYRAKVRGVTTYNIAVVHFNDRRLVDLIIMNHRPLSAALQFSSLLGERFGDQFGRDLFYAGKGAPPLLDD